MIRFIGPDGKLISRSRFAVNKTDAKDIRDQLIKEFGLSLQQPKDSDLTMRQLLDRFRKSELIPAAFLGERKVAGYKHPDKVESYLKILETYWQDKFIRSITPQDLLEFKRYLIALPKERGGGPRTVQNVNGINRHLRLVLNYAVRNRWLDRNPVSDIKGFIDASNEMPRKRPEGKEDLEKLLAQCVYPRDHLRPWIVIAIETALRPGEIDKLTRADIDWKNKILVARATNTKTNRYREVPMTKTVENELRVWFDTLATDEEWRERVPDSPNALIFGGMKSNRRAFKTACKLAGITNLQRKDLRKWGATRLATALRQAGIPDLHGMAITGHSVVKTYQSYVITDRDAVDESRKALEAYKRAETKKKAKSHAKAGKKALKSNAKSNAGSNSEG